MYAIKISEFQQVLHSCCMKRRAAIEEEQIEKRNRTPAAPTTPKIKLRIPRSSPTRLEIEFEEEYF